MAVREYSLKTDGDRNLEKNFKVSEFRCYDGSDRIRIDTELVTVLQKIRDHFGKPTVINSGFRTESHNRSVGGAEGSYHVKGMAADIDVQGENPLKVALFLEKLLEKGGVGCYFYPSGGFVHVDTRDYKSRWVQAQSTGSYDTADNLMPMIRLGSRGEAVKIAQRELGGLAADGVFGPLTQEAVMGFQKKRKLDVDGIIGPDTWKALSE